MNKSDSIVNLSDALTKAQAELKPVAFDAVNPFLKNKYATLGAVIEEAKPVLAKYGLAVTQLPTDMGGIGVETVLLHGSGEWISSTISLPLGEEKGKSLAQVSGSIITYLRRYALSSILGMYAEADDDGNGNQPLTGAGNQPTGKTTVGKTVPPPTTDERPWYVKQIEFAKAHPADYALPLGQTEIGKAAITRLRSMIGAGLWFAAPQNMANAIKKYTGFGKAEEVTWPKFERLVRAYVGPYAVAGEQVKDVLFDHFLKPASWQELINSIPLEVDMVLDEQTAAVLEAALVGAAAYVNQETKKLDIESLAASLRAHFIKHAVDETVAPDIDLDATESIAY